MGMVQVLHYYCKRRRAELLNDITFKKGISCQIQTDFLDISDIVKELTNKNHIDCVAIDEDLFGIGDIEDIISKLEVLKFVTDETKILIIALDHMRNDEMIQGIQKSGVVDYIITKEMIDDFDDVISKFFDGTITENEKILYTPSNNEMVMTLMIFRKKVVCNQKFILLILKITVHQRKIIKANILKQSITIIPKMLLSKKQLFQIVKVIYSVG